MIIDLYFVEFINSNIKNPFFDYIMPKITWLGNYGIIWILVAVLLLASPRYKKVGAILIFALLLCTILGEAIIKHIFDRPRPFTIDETLQVLIKHPKSYSFPSGHTASSFVVLTIFLLNIKNRLYSYLIGVTAFLIAFSRMYLNVHYLTDVLGGMLLGIASAVLIHIVVKKIEKNNEI